MLIYEQIIWQAVWHPRCLQAYVQWMAMRGRQQMRWRAGLAHWFERMLEGEQQRRCLKCILTCFVLENGMRADSEVTSLAWSVARDRTYAYWIVITRLGDLDSTSDVHLVYFVLLETLFDYSLFILWGCHVVSSSTNMRTHVSYELFHRLLNLFSDMMIKAVSQTWVTAEKCERAHDRLGTNRFVIS